MRNPMEECPSTDCPTCGAADETLGPCVLCRYDSVCVACGYCTNPQCPPLSADDRKDWVQFTKRTENPKLRWIEGQLDLMGIPSRRHGRSFHAPILEVPRRLLDKAWSILERPNERYGNVDEVPDDHRMFR
jgi:hypothetical protein